MTNYLQKIESTQEIIEKEHLAIICLPKNTCLNVLRRILLQHRCWPFGIYFFCLLFKCILATIFFHTVSEWIKDLLNFLTGMILWRRLIFLLPQTQFKFFFTYEIMRIYIKVMGRSDGTEHKMWVNKESHLWYL